MHVTPWSVPASDGWYEWVPVIALRWTQSGVDSRSIYRHDEHFMRSVYETTDELWRAQEVCCAKILESQQSTYLKISKHIFVRPFQTFSKVAWCYNPLKTRLALSASDECPRSLGGRWPSIVDRVMRCECLRRHERFSQFRQHASRESLHKRRRGRSPSSGGLQEHRHESGGPRRQFKHNRARESARIIRGCSHDNNFYLLKKGSAWNITVNRHSMEFLGIAMEPSKPEVN